MAVAPHLAAPRSLRTMRAVPHAAALPVAAPFAPAAPLAVAALLAGCAPLAPEPPSAPAPAASAPAPADGAAEATGTPHRGWSASGAPVHALAYAPDGLTIATGDDDGGLKLWDSASGTLRCAAVEEGRHLASVAFSPDGAHVATGSWSFQVQNGGAYATDGAVRIWSAGDCKLERTLLDHAQMAVSVAYSPGGLSLAALETKAHRVTVWDTTTGESTASFPASEAGTAHLTFAPDGRLAIGSCDGIALFDPRKGAAERQIATCASAAAFSPNGSLLVTAGVDAQNGASDTYEVTTWDAATGAQLRRIPLAYAQAFAVAFSPGGTSIASGGKGSQVNVWTTAAARPVHAWKAAAEVVHAVAFAPDGKSLATAGSDGRVEVWPL